MRLPRLPHTAAAVLTLTAAALGAGASSATAAPYVPGEVIVKYKDDAVTGGAVGPAPASKRMAVGRGSSVKAALSRLRNDPRVEYAVPNYKARISGLTPNDPGFRQQWNLQAGFGINMPDAWDLAKARKAPGGRGVTVAVLDTGVAYQRFSRFRRVPDLNRFVRGYDYVDGDSHPNDENGHGTHVSGTIAQSTGNGTGAAGIAYKAKIMPVRVLDAEGAGDTFAIARGIRYAVRHKAKIINMSLEFDASVRASQIPDLVSAMRYARQKGVLVVAAAGNQADSQVAYPARAKDALAVSATTIRGCLAEYSNVGADVDLTAPGGGRDAVLSDNPYDASTCKPELAGQFIYQQTFTSSVRSFGLPRGYEGTSMAAPHVSGVAALVVASKRLGKRPSAALLTQHLQATSRDLGTPGFDKRYGYGLLDAAAALR